MAQDPALLTPVEEADRLLAALAEHQERELPEARAQLEEAIRLEAGIPAIRAEAAAGCLTADQADARIGAIRAGVATAQERSEDADRLRAELRRRTAEAGSGAVAAMLAAERESLALAARAQREAEELLELRRVEHERALTRFREAERDGDALLARYDRDHSARLGEEERRKEERIRWALRQPRIAIEQLPLDWQREAYDRYDQLEAEAATRRRQIEQGRDTALVNPRNGAQSEIRL